MRRILCIGAYSTVLYQYGGQGARAFATDDDEDGLGEIPTAVVEPHASTTPTPPTASRLSFFLTNVL